MHSILRYALALALSSSLALHAGPGLVKAAISGDVDAVKERLAAGENINEPGKNGWTPLMWAVWYRQLPVTELLLEKGADPNLQATDSYKSYAKGATALIIASFDCLEDQTAALVKKKAKIDLVDANGNTAEKYARKHECPAVLRAMGFKAAANRALDVLLEGINAGKDINLPDQYGWTPLMWSVYYADLPTTQFLLEKGADPNLKSTVAHQSYGSGTTALIIAGMGGLDDQAEALMKAKAKADIADATGKTAVDYARKGQYIPVLSALGVPANQQLETMLKAIAAGKNVNAADEFGWTPLMWAVYYRDRYTTKSLLDLGADPNLQSTESYMAGPKQNFPKGTTALIIASKMEQGKIASLLLEKKAKVHLADATGTTAETYAYENSFYDFLDLMVDRTPLEKPYNHLAIQEFTGFASLSKDYGYVLTDCRTGLQEFLSEKKAFESIEPAGSGKTYAAGTLVLQAEIIQLHMPSAAARFFVGPLAGRTNMDIKVKLIDAATGKLEREQIIRSANSIWLSAFTLGARDENFAKETGAVIAGYVLTITGKVAPQTEGMTSK